jgi:hypothetical protein
VLSQKGCLIGKEKWRSSAVGKWKICRVSMNLSGESDFDGNNRGVGGGARRGAQIFTLACCIE